MLIAQISDLHFLPKGMLGFGRIDVAGCLERAIDHLNALQPRPDAVLITGDLTNGSGANVWAELLGMLARLTAPIYPLPGNHDDREQMRAAFAHLGLFGARRAALLRGRSRAAAADRPGQPDQRRAARAARARAARVARCPAR